MRDKEEKKRLKERYNQKEKEVDVLREKKKINRRTLTRRTRMKKKVDKH